MAAGLRQRHGLKCRGGKCSCAWQAEVYLAREGRKLRKTFATREQAKAWRTDALADVKRGKLIAPSNVPTVAEAAEAFIAGATAEPPTIKAAGKRPYKPATIRGYAAALRKYVVPALGRMKLNDVRRADVQDFADALAQDFKPNTVTNIIDSLRVLFRRAIHLDLIALDPTEHVELDRPEKHDPRIATPVEAAALIAALPERDRALWATAFYAGLRRGELRALRVADIDLDARVIRVERGWDEEQGEQAPKSAAGVRRVPILEPLAPILGEHLLRTDRWDDALVFGRTATEPFAPQSVRERSLRVWGEADLDPIGLHECRHTCASVLIESKANAKALSVIMGHANIAVTFDVYGHIMPGGLDEVAADANAYLARGEQVEAS